MLDAAVLGYQPVTIYLVIAGCVGLLCAAFLFFRVRAVKTQIDYVEPEPEGAKLTEAEDTAKSSEHKEGEHHHGGRKRKKVYRTREQVAAINTRLTEIYEAVRHGADSFLMAEYQLCVLFVCVFAVVLVVLSSHIGNAPGNGADSQGFNWTIGGYAVLAYAIGAFCSIFTGYISMKVAVYSNVRTCVAACKPTEAEGYTHAFGTAMNAGAIDGFLLCSCALLVLFFLCSVFELHFGSGNVPDAKLLFEAIAGFGLGGSCIAMFGRVGGGIFTKAADVGSDLAGKVVENIPEDDPRNPGVIADNVGDNVGDVAGMGSDLFGSFAEASCAALIVGSTSEDIVRAGWGALMFPLVISATGIYTGIITHFFAELFAVKNDKGVLRALKIRLAVSTLLVTAALWPVIMGFLPADFEVEQRQGSTVKVFFSICVGLWGGCLIGFVTEYFTAYEYRPTQEVAEATETGPATVVIYGIALGYRSAVIPIIILCVDIFVSFYLLGMYGVALCALGMLATLCTCLTIDVYGPICDNGGGFAEMASNLDDVREITDELDAAGNTTAAIGKGFAIGSAALVSLSLLGAFVTRVRSQSELIMCHKTVDILQPITFACLVFGAMIPYWFSALTLKSVGKAAKAMVLEIKRQFKEIDGLLEGREGVKPETEKCIAIATRSSLKEMVLPGLLIIFSPIIVGVLLGVNALAGFLCGSMSSGVQIAISMSNTGGAWDNAKKYVEKERLFFYHDGPDGKPVPDAVPQKKRSEAHKAAVVGDTVGDPFKDTSGPAVNIVMKLMAIISLVFADFFMSINDGHGGFNIINACAA